MKAITLLLLCLLLNCYTFSQNQSEWAPIGAKWTYSLPINYGNAMTYVTIESVSDTTIQGKDCKVLKQLCMTDPHYLNNVFYTYGNQDSVWLFDGTDFRLLYDFSANAGSSWEIYGPNFQQAGNCDTVTHATVDSIGFENINGNSYKYLYVSLQDFGWQFSLCDYLRNKISQKFGSYGYLFPQHICMIDPPYPCELRCYEDPEFGFYQLTNYDSCTYQYGVGIEEISLANHLKIYPNPVVNELFIQSTDYSEIGTIYIYSIQGRCVLIQDSGYTKVSVDMTLLDAGTYYYRIVKDNAVATGKFIKR